MENAVVGNVGVVDKILNLTQNLLQQQSNILTFVFGITALLLACTWLWNLFIARRKMRNEIQRQISRIEKGFNNKAVELEKAINKKLKDDLLKHEVEINRLFALTSKQAGLPDISTTWWGSALKASSKIGNDLQIRRATNNILYNLRETGVCGLLDKEKISWLINIVKVHVPEILYNEKDEILKLLEAEIKKK